MTSSLAPKKRRTNDPEGMRERILDASYQLFVIRGYHATATQDILASAGVTSGALHHHFPTKKKLGLAVMRERVAKAVQLAWIDPLDKAPSGISGALSVFDAIARGLKDQGQVRGCPLNNLTIEMSYVDPDFRAIAQDIFSQWVVALTALLKADQRQGWRTDLDAQSCAALIVAAYSGAMGMAKAEQNERPLLAVRKSLEALLA